MCVLSFHEADPQEQHNESSIRLYFFLTLLKASLVSSFALATQEAVRNLSRIAGPRWNVNGDWAPTVEEVQSHRRAAHGIDPANLSMEDLLTLHDNDHNRGGYHTGHAHKKATKSSTKGYAKF